MQVSIVKPSRTDRLIRNTIHLKPSTMSLEDFETVAEAMKNLTTSPTDDERLELYALYKQATVGDINTDEDIDADEETKAKRSAWESKKGMTQDEAKVAYVNYAEPLLEKYKSE